MSTKGCVFGRYSPERIAAARRGRYGGQTPIDRFWEKVDKSGECWIWLGTVGTHGYGIQGRLLAHRTSYEYLGRPIPEGLELDHLCRNRRCVNPDHLEPVTHEENVRRGPWGAREYLTHCKNGHEYTSENTYRWARTGHRRCRTCQRIAKRRRVAWSAA